MASVNYSSFGSDNGEFGRLAQTIGTNIQKISQNVSSIQRIVSQLGTGGENLQLQNQLHQIQHYTGQLAKDTSKNLKELGNLPLPLGDQRVYKLQRERLLNDFTAVLNTFQSLQRESAQREKDEFKKVKTQNMNEPALLMNEAGPRKTQTQTQMQEDVDLTGIQERDRAIRQLESDIVDVNTIFKELATMVHEQGEVIDSIEANVESAQMRIEEGNEQLYHASSYQSKARRKKCILITIAAIILAVLIGIIIWQTR